MAEKARVRKAPSTGRAIKQKQKILDVGLRVTIDGTVYEVRYGDITPALARELRAVSGMGWHGLMEAMQSPELDLMQTFMWLSRRVKGERVDIDDVELDYDQLFDIEENDVEPLTDAAEAGTDPEA